MNPTLPYVVRTRPRRLREESVGTCFRCYKMSYRANQKLDSRRAYGGDGLRLTISPYANEIRISLAATRGDYVLLPHKHPVARGFFIRASCLWVEG